MCSLQVDVAVTDRYYRELLTLTTAAALTEERDGRPYQGEGMDIKKVKV